jgi:hypothetical protein
MKITKNEELLAKFRAGLIIVGEDEENNLRWLGTKKQWDKSEQNINPLSFGGGHIARHYPEVLDKFNNN